jgi:hypothetical protein
MDGIFLGHNLLLSRASSGGNPLMDGIFGYQEALYMNFFFFHDGISAIRKPFLTNFFLFSRWYFGYQEALSHELFSFFTMEFSRHIIRNMQLGGKLFSYIY